MSYMSLTSRTTGKRPCSIWRNYSGWKFRRGLFPSRFQVAFTTWSFVVSERKCSKTFLASQAPKLPEAKATSQTIDCSEGLTFPHRILVFGKPDGDSHHAACRTTASGGHAGRVTLPLAHSNCRTGNVALCYNFQSPRICRSISPAFLRTKPYCMDKSYCHISFPRYHRILQNAVVAGRMSVVRLWASS